MKWAAILFALFIVLIIVLADADRLGILALISQIPFGDKAGHFTLYGILALLINLSVFRSRPFQSRTRVAVMIGLTLAVLIGLEEFSQQFFAARSFDLVDLTFSYLGVIFFSWLAVRTKKQKAGVNASSR
ncbi:MAG TPA: VanZ family protein [Anaerolineales bacterium]|nr:VanZ family protein [Anaerolineales bacterium]